ncbi:MAG: FHA domain-containing protein [Chloroflexaceae bacterium]|nr:FHA domain-containing protein [Chloroflexaceae bacterium]
MQRCKNCGTEQLDGAIFCSECGASLLKEDRGDDTTTTLGHKRRDPSQDLPPGPSAPPFPTAGSSVCLIVVNSDRRIHLEKGKDFIIGRASSKEKSKPDVDLSGDGGYSSGVSRQHAIISVQERDCRLKDLQSSNGTFVNGKRLKPHRPVTIKHGDELKFGTLLVRIEFCFS